MSNNIIENKSFNFAIEIVKTYKQLINEKKEFVMSKQLLRAGTSIGANVKEALEGQSKRDFLSKMNISLKESSETEYWIKLLITTEYLNPNEGTLLLGACIEVKRILHSIVKTTKLNLK